MDFLLLFVFVLCLTWTLLAELLRRQRLHY
jgi:hypothetical protein